MSWLTRLLPFLAGRPASDRPPTVLVEFLADRGRLDQELAALRAEVASGHVQDREQLSDLAERLTTTGRAIEEALTGAVGGFRADLATATGAIEEGLSQGQVAIDELRREVGKLGREQFRATTLLEGQAMVLEELGEAWREHLSQREGEAADFRQALADLEGEVRLGFVKDLLPVGDALSESVQAARDLLDELRPEPRRAVSVLGRLLGASPAGDYLATESRRAALEGWLKGLLLVERRLLALLDREDVRPIPTIGEPFDPHRHVAVAVERDGGVPDGTIVREELRGYLIDDRVLRHAEVVVARGGSDEQSRWD